VARETSPRQGQRKGDFLAGKYLLEDCLGIGGMGEVYRATNVSLGRKVAIKILSAEYVKNEDDVLRFLREARAAAAVRHPNVVDVLDVARDDDGTPFIVQELLAGEDLEHYLSSRGGRLSAAEALEIMIAVAEAVAAAHARDVVHRDLKPANIYLSKEGTKITPKVLDFGACLFPTLGALSSKELRMLIGTPHYMAPEQIVSKTDVDQRADVWALGIIMYELMVGETPFEAETANAVLQLVKTREVPPLRTVLKDATADMEELVAACTQRDKMKRLANAAAVVDKMSAVRDRMRGSTRMKVDTVPEMDAAKPTPRPIDRPRPASDIKQTAKIAESRIPSLLFPDKDNTPTAPPRAAALDSQKKTPDLSPPTNPMAKRRALLTLSQPGASDPPPPSSRRSAEPPASEQRPIESSRGGLADLALDDPMPSSPPPAPKKAGSSLSPRHEKDFEADPDDAKLDLRLAAQPKWKAPNVDEPPPPSRRGEKSDAEAKKGSSIPPVLDPRAAVPPARATSSVRPPPMLGAEAPPPSTPATTPGLHRPRTPAIAAAPVAEPLPWRSKDTAMFIARVGLPAALLYGLFMGVTALSAPIGRAMRGDSTLASGILAVVVLVIALALCAKSVAGTKERALFVCAGGAVLLGIVMIIVTSGAGEAAELGVPAAGSALVPFLAPIAPIAGAFASIRRARHMWLHPYEKREANLYATLGSVLVFLALLLSPVGAVLRR
jgi:eukaryotic-like serine/threonine-protein kinase